MRPRLLPLAVLWMVACQHSPSFPPLEFTDGLLPAAPTRMTYSSTSDVLLGHGGPDDEVFYRYCARPMSEGSTLCRTPDTCVGALPVRGGQRTISICGATSSDSVRTIGAAARAPDGAVAWSYAARHWTASFSLTQVLLLVRPGGFDTLQLASFAPLPEDPNLPRRLWWLSAGELLVESNGGFRLLTFGAGGEVTTTALDGAHEAVDAGRRRFVSSVDDTLLVSEIGSDAVIRLEVPAPPEWHDVLIVMVAASDGRYAVVQAGNTTPNDFATRFHRLVVWDPEEGGLQEVARVGANPWKAVSLARDGGSVVVQLQSPGVVQDDLYRLEVPGGV
jgi:hypothetical protein